MAADEVIHQTVTYVNGVKNGDSYCTVSPSD